jgi:hypothetical protein
VCAALSLACWGASTPTGSSPDDDFHLASIWCADGPAKGAVAGDVCTEVNGHRSPGTVVRVLPESVALADCGTWFTSVTACEAYKVSQVCNGYVGPPSPVCSGSLRPGTGAHAANAGLYPGGFYRTMHLFTSADVTASIVWMRIANAVLAMALIGLAFVVSEGRSRSAYALTVMVGVCTPIGFVFIPSSNPTAWSVIGLGCLWMFVLAYMSTASAWRRWLALAGALLAWALPVSARADSPALAILVIGGAAVIGNRGLSLSRRVVFPGVLLIASFVAFLLGSGTSVAQSGISTVAAGDGSSPPAAIADSMAHNAAHPFSLFVHNLLGLWPYERDMFTEGHWTWVLPAAIVLMLVAAVVAYRGWQRVAYTVMLIGALAIPMYVAQRSHLSVSIWYMQRRYLFPLMVAVIGLALVGLARRGWVDRVAGRRWLVGALWALLSVIASFALHLEILRYTVGWHVYQFNFDAHRTWWWANAPISPMAVWVAGSIAMAGLIALLLLVAVASSLAEAPDPQDRTTIDPRESTAA